MANVNTSNLDSRLASHKAALKGLTVCCCCCAAQTLFGPAVGETTNLAITDLHVGVTPRQVDFTGRTGVLNAGLAQRTGRRVDGERGFVAEQVAGQRAQDEPSCVTTASIANLRRSARPE
jgi:hypothetical protein